MRQLLRKRLSTDIWRVRMIIHAHVEHSQQSIPDAWFRKD